MLCMRRKKGYSRQISEEQFTVDTLLSEVEALLENKDFYIQNMEQSTEIQSVDSFYRLLMEDIGR